MFLPMTPRKKASITKSPFELNRFQRPGREQIESCSKKKGHFDKNPRQPCPGGFPFL
jgi:hypothetical protein